MIIGGVVAILHGTALPIAMVIFGNLTNSFVNQFTSAQLANFDNFTFDPVEYIMNGRLADVDISVLAAGFINFTNITGGIVNCSEDYVLLPPENNFNEILQLGVTELASCLDNEEFISQINWDILWFVVIAAAVFVLGWVQVSFFQLSAERQAHKMQLNFYRAILRQDVGWFDTVQTGALSSKLSE